MRGSATVFSILLLPLAAQGQTAATLASCGSGPATESGLAGAWQTLRELFVVTKPTEVQRLVELRLDVNNLYSAKKELIGKVQAIVDIGSTPGWLQTRLVDLPRLQDRVFGLVTKIENEARNGQGLAANKELAKVLDTLQERRLLTLCEMAKIPLPLDHTQIYALTTLLNLLKEENAELEKFDEALTSLIAAAKK
jgi:hypothetical protein